MLTCTKTYQDIPFAHRQHKHDGHCKLIHGHNWAITLTFACRELDENGFVIDFGKLKFIRAWIDENLDHACLFNEDDPTKDALINAVPGAFKPYVLPSCSSEGLATHLHEIFNKLVLEKTNGRTWIVQIDILEDSKNSASFRPENPNPSLN